LVTFLSVFEMGSSAIGVAVLIGFLAGVVEEPAKTGHADATEDAEDVALVVVELWWGFPTEHEKIVAEEGLDTSQAEVGEAGAVVEESVDALGTLVRMKSCFQKNVRTARVRLVQ
jgi:hypothetical protein